MLEKFKKAVDHIMELRPTKEEMVEIFSGLQILILTSITWTKENEKMVKEMEQYVFEKSGVDLRLKTA